MAKTRAQQIAAIKATLAKAAKQAATISTKVAAVTGKPAVTTKAAKTKTPIKTPTPDLSAISAGVKEVTAKIPELTKRVGGVAKKPVTAKSTVEPTTKPATPVETKEADFDVQIKKANEEWQKKFEEMQKGFEKTQVEAEKKTEDILTKMGETATADTLAKFEETQKGIIEAYQSYFDEQSEYLKELQEQPSVVESLQKFREEQGLPQMERELAGVDQTILDTEGLLSNIEEDIRIRTEGLPVTEAAARRLTAMEQRPLTQQLTDLIRGRQRVAAGLEAKQATVSQFMTAQEAELAKQQEIAGTRLGFAKERAEVGVDIQTQSFDLFSDLQNKMFEIDKLRLDVVANEQGYKNELAKMGFDFFSVMMAEQKADIKDQEAFQQELIKIQLEKEMEALTPDFRFETKTDAAGNVFMIQTDKRTGATDVINMGAIGKPTAAKTEAVSITKAKAEALTELMAQIPNYSSQEEALRELDSLRGSIVTQVGEDGYKQIVDEVKRVLPTTTTAETKPSFLPTGEELKGFGETFGVGLKGVTSDVKSFFERLWPF